MSDELSVVMDIETYPNCITLAAEHCDYPIRWAFEISDYRDDSVELIEWCRWIADQGGRMVGFNNVGFDYPILHTLIKMGKGNARVLYEKAMAIIHSSDENRFAHMVFPSDRFVEQIDLFKIMHFDNKARATSLKVIEFNMRMDNVSDLPFPVGTPLNPEQIKVLKEYNAHDVTATKRFYHECLPMIRFREELTAKHGRDFMNHNDVKIGKEIFQMELEKVGVTCYQYGPDGRQPKQTKRPTIALKDCISEWIKFETPEFQRVRDWMAQQTITETKGVFKDVIAHAFGLDFVFGTGGIHASVENKIYRADDEMMILDVDVTSLYPSIAIENGYYPEHLGPRFVQVYRDLRAQRVGYKKGTAENAMLKLALNGVYGASNDQFSVFFDPLFTMKITIGGQLMLCMLVEALAKIPTLEFIACNTDGVCMTFSKPHHDVVKSACAVWEAATRLTLEHVDYRMIAIADVNSYVSYATKGEVKRKGRYEYDLEWHQNQSALVIPKVAEQVLLHGKPIRETLATYTDPLDYCLRVKVPRSSKLLYDEDQIQNTTRYYVAKGGGTLIKVMPPLKGKTEWRRFAVEKGWGVCVCNKIEDAVMPIDYDYYIAEIEKLTLGMK